MSYEPVANPAPLAQPPARTGHSLGVAGLILCFLVPPVGLLLCVIALAVSRRSGFRNRPAMTGLILTLVGHALIVILLLVLDPLFMGDVTLPEGAVGPLVGFAVLIIIMDVGIVLGTALVLALFRYVLRPTIFKNRVRTSISLAILIPLGAFAVYVYREEIVVVATILGSMLLLSIVGIIGLSLMGSTSSSSRGGPLQGEDTGGYCPHNVPHGLMCTECVGGRSALGSS